RKARWIFPVPWPIPIGANAEAPARASNTAWVQHATHRSHPNAKQAGRHKHGNHRSYAWLIAPMLRVAGHGAPGWGSHAGGWGPSERFRVRRALAANAGASLPSHSSANLNRRHPTIRPIPAGIARLGSDVLRAGRPPASACG